jgi:hypothetical protein
MCATRSFSTTAHFVPRIRIAVGFEAPEPPGAHVQGDQFEAVDAPHQPVTTTGA